MGYAVAVALEDAVDSVLLGPEDVTVQRKAVRGSVLRPDTRTEPISWNLFVRIIILKDFADCLNGLHILILRSHVVKRAALVGSPIRESEVDSNVEIDLAASEDVLEEVCALNDLEAP